MPIRSGLAMDGGPHRLVCEVDGLLDVAADPRLDDLVQRTVVAEAGHEVLDRGALADAQRRRIDDHSFGLLERHELDRSLLDDVALARPGALVDEDRPG